MKPYLIIKSQRSFIFMKKISIESLVLAAVCLIFSASTVYAEDFAETEDIGAVVITEPTTGSTVSSPVKVCMAVDGVMVQPAKKGINPGTGHHHLLIDINLPRDLSKMLDKDSNHIHMGDGSTCKELKLVSGKHIIRTLFATGFHVPYNPAITSTVIFTVK
jgi:hypothetical protein